jgi:hypothetical protein
MTQAEVESFVRKVAELNQQLQALSLIAPQLREAFQPVLNQLAIAQTEARVEAMLHARGRGLADEDCLKLAQEVKFLPL